MKIYAKVEGQHYEFERPETDSRGFVINSSAKYCPLCLAGWAHMTAVIDGPRMKGNHCVTGQICARCGRVEQQLGKLIGDRVSGSLLEEPQTNCQTLDWDLLDYLPLALLLREFNLHYEFLIAKELSNGNTAMAGQESPRRDDSDTSNVREVGL